MQRPGAGVPAYCYEEKSWGCEWELSVSFTDEKYQVVSIKTIPTVKAFDHFAGEKSLSNFEQLIKFVL